MKEREKIINYKEIIEKLYCIEGRSKSYISRLLDVDRKVLTNMINNEWKLEPAQVYHITPSTEKWIKKNKNFVISQLNKDERVLMIAEKLECTYDFINHIIQLDDDMKAAAKAKEDRMHAKAEEQRIAQKEKSSHTYESSCKIEGEEWKPILGYDDYFVSNLGRVKKFIKTHNDYLIMALGINCRSGRVHVGIQDANGKSHKLSLARLVAFAFVDGYSEETCTVDHIDGDVTNNKASNLRWLSQSDNNKAAYDNGRERHGFHSRRKFKKIILDNKYEFKSIEACARFLNISATQCSRYIDGECKTEHTFNLV